MDREQLKQDLHRRIEQLRQWATADSPELLAGLTVRNHPCSARPVAFLDEPKRAERHGVRLRLVIESPKGAYETFLDVRIQPEGAKCKDGSIEPPYIVFYARDPEQEQADPMTHEFFENLENHRRTQDRSVQDWLHSRLQRALDHPKVSKLLAVKRRLD